MQTLSSIIALDVGERRIGVALADSVVRLASPFVTLTNDEDIWAALGGLLGEHDVSVVVVGLPRNLDGDETSQTAYTRTFASQLAEHTDLPIEFQDEAVTSRKAEAELRARKKPYAKSDIDALAATYILEDYLNTHREALA